MRRLLRRHVPEGLRRSIATLRRAAADRLTGRHRSLARGAPDAAATAAFTSLARVRQPVRITAHSDGKIANLKLAAGRISHVVIPPGGLLSFWHLIGRPSEASGFQLGRSIVSDRLTADIGGGLCQVSGLLYELGLIAGMEVVERHPHSRDLYTEDSRFTPLGLDATVVHGFKDLRLANVGREPLAFVLTVGDGWIEGEVLAPLARPVCVLEVTRDDAGSHRRARVGRRHPNGRIEAVSDGLYVIDAA